ncbi:hypothetical protein GCM10007424_11140 [Flavobacterium suaedae]|uniref:Uncharacterized protein n=1 Tax=Flavobacterium suaedae TaxID=1767027 RepID=A0ABQ1JS71_9FLAO|nr:hypothetical protein [Flavobacterium suaedae]GGB72960.1 hypothetical protein GCM10007424_11140 [Flavobacterium suaedae]
MKKFLLLPICFIAISFSSCSSEETEITDEVATQTKSLAVCTNVNAINPSITNIQNNDLLFQWSSLLIHRRDWTFSSWIEIRNAGCTGSSTVTTYTIDIFNTPYYILYGGIDGGSGTDNCFEYRLVVESYNQFTLNCRTATDWISYP